MTDVGSLPFMQAQHYHQGRIATPRLVVIHTMEAPQGPQTAEAMQRMFASQNSPQASAHVGFDQDGGVRCVHDQDTAWAAPNANSDGLHAEHAGRATQSPGDWMSQPNKSMLGISGSFTALWSREYGIPPIKLTPAQVADGRTKGFCGHLDVTQAFNTPGGHTDPGTNFPWDYYLGIVKSHQMPPAGSRKKNPYPMPAIPVDCRGGNRPGPTYAWVQWALGLPETGKPDTQLANAVAALQKRMGLQVDGVLRQPEANVLAQRTRA